MIKAVTTFVKTKEEKTIRKHIGVTMKNILFIYWDTDPIIEQNKNVNRKENQKKIQENFFKKYFFNFC